MATTPYQIFPGSIGAGPYTVTFELPGSFSAIRVKLKKADDDNYVTQTVDVQYSVVRATKTVTFLTGFEPESGDSVRIERYTTRDRQIDYVSGQTLSERNLDNDTNRLTMIDQEIESDLLDALRRNDARDAWDAEGIPSENAADAEKAGGWVTLRQLQSFGHEPVDISGATVFPLGPGDGVTSEYELIGAENLTTAMVDAYVSSVYQSSSGTDFQILNPDDSLYPSWAGGVYDVLSFTDPPTNGATIEVKIITGSVTADIATGSVGTLQIADDAVTEDQMHAAIAGDITRFFIADAAGDVAASRQIGVADLLDTDNGDLASGVVRSAILNDIRISDFVNPANANIAMGGNKITGLSTAAPTAAADAASKQYVDGQIGTVTPSSARFASGVIPALGAGQGVAIGAAEGISFIPDIVWWYNPGAAILVGGLYNALYAAQTLTYHRAGAQTTGPSPGYDHGQSLRTIAIGGSPTHGWDVIAGYISSGLTTGFYVTHGGGTALAASAFFAIKI